MNFILSLIFHSAISSVISAFNILTFFVDLVKRSFFGLKEGKELNRTKLAIVITGCDSGFGELSSRRLAALGFHVISGCVTDDGLNRLTGVVPV
jgi:hypothetical protein